MVSIPFLFWGISSFSFLDPDEGMWGSIALEMARQGDWIIPHFNGLPYLEKPPLYFWLSASMIQLFGPEEWAVRIWSGLSAFGTALLVWRMGEWLYGRLAGLLSALVLVTSVGIYHHAHFPGADLPLVFCLTLSLFGFVDGLLHGKGSRSGYWIFYLGAGLGVLAKGLVGLIFPCLIVGLFLISTGRVKILGSMNLKFGVPLFLSVALPWHLLAAWRNPDLLAFYLFNNHWLRFLNERGFAEEDVPLGTLSFLAMFLIWFFPWSFSLPAVVPHLLSSFRDRGKLRESLPILLGVWVIVVLGVFSLSFSKLEHYSLPALPPVSLLVGGWWARAIRSRDSQKRSWLTGNRLMKWSLGLGAAGCLMLGGFFLRSGSMSSGELLSLLSPVNSDFRTLAAQGLAFPFAFSPYLSLLWWLGWILALGPLVSWVFVIRGSGLAGYAAQLGIAVGIGFLVFKNYLLIAPYKSVIPVTGSAAVRENPDARIIHEGLLENSGGLVFYTGKRIEVFNGRGGSLEFGARQPQADEVFLDRKRLLEQWRGPRRVFLVSRYPYDGSIAKDLPRDESIPMGKFGSRWLYMNKPLFDDVSGK